jgi:phage gpG-like protein
MVIAMATKFVRTPDIANPIRDAIVRAFQQGAQIVQHYAILNVTGKVLKIASGQLASKIYTKVTKTRRGGTLRVGTRVHYGAFWERGFIHRAGRSLNYKYMAPRPWLRPAAEQAIPEITNLMELELDRELKGNFNNVTIDIKLS